MKALRFERDERKSSSNRRKHGVSFEEAETVFSDQNGLLLADPDHSDEEDRFLLLGLSSAVRLVMVCHCYRSQESVIRIISARRADKSEREQYVRRWLR